MLCYAKSLQSCPTLCDPIDGSPPGSPIPGILQARTLEWAAISFSNVWKWKVKVKSLSRVRLLATPWTAAYQAPSMGFSKQEYWSGVPLPSPKDHYWCKIFCHKSPPYCSLPHSLSWNMIEMLWIIPGTCLCTGRNTAAVAQKRDLPHSLLQGQNVFSPILPHSRGAISEFPGCIFTLSLPLIGVTLRKGH